MACQRKKKMQVVNSNLNTQIPALDAIPSNKKSRSELITKNQNLKVDLRLSLENLQ